MKLVSKKAVGRLPVYDLSVKDKEQYVFENGIVTHNTGIRFASNSVFFMSKSQEKDGTELAGYKFTIIANKSRNVREKSKFPLTVLFETGINKYSGLLDLAIELGFVNKPSIGFYSRLIEGVQEDKKWRASKTNNGEFWDVLLNDPKFDEACINRYKLGRGEINPSNVDEHLEDDLDIDDIEVE